MLFTVNAGCNTVSMFEIDPNDPTHPKLIGRPAPTGGDFPVSIDYSPKYRKGTCIVRKHVETPANTVHQPAC